VADRNGVIRRWESGCLDLLGYTTEEAVGHSLDLIVPPVLQARHWQGFTKAVTTGRLKRPNTTLKLPMVHKSGAVVAGELADGTLVQAEDGSVSGVEATLLGPGPRWTAAAWRAVLGLLTAGQAVARVVSGRSRSVR
jgi:PAS domain S-box-containing protein